ncbi:RNA polymerase, sigma subunit, ECF family [Nannocystis exedens]|uniref:RNA polymerase, sigma subunit, ECF family n=1 Tax=Nannocystis exedens TaxID=54 RepID=A0A1I2ATZ7_9BACT|nr:sigma-70 family RNA polymerase sigma factor [Nannocystis exedens]PCC74268.1 DNA-directed RNA polymerase sigma-70 factor [Nannocystis exedens]SFE47306.1 RNA polymerase, sigma subunit, ECF family [Nannocystis exedens]
MATDSELFAAWQAGDAEAGDELVGRHFAAVARFFRNKVATGGEDLIQHTFLGCLEARARFRQESSFRTFLFSIARNVLLAHLRTLRRAHDRQVDFGVSSLFDLDPSPSQIVAREQEQQLLLDALRRLPVDLQLALELFYWEGLPLAELAQVLEVPPGTVKSRLFRARQQLKEQLEQLARTPALLRDTLERIDALDRAAAERGA